jgi:phage terminase large subunit-like protein
MVINFPLKDGTRHVKSWFWIPEKKVREKEDHVDYCVWKKEGFINVIGGDAINHQELATDVLKILSRYNVMGMSYDKWGIGEAVIQAMIDMGYPTSKLHPIKQTTGELQRSIRKMEEEILLQKINHEGHPILRWNVQNTVLYHDTFGGVKFNKSKAVEKIDGSVAMAMSFAEEINNDGPIQIKGVRYV